MAFKLKAYHVDRLNESFGSYSCEERENVLQETNFGVISRRCARPAVVIVRVNARSWGNNYCALHARLKQEELLVEVSQEPEPEPVKDDAEAD